MSFRVSWNSSSSFLGVFTIRVLRGWMSAQPGRWSMVPAVPLLHGVAEGCRWRMSVFPHEPPRVASLEARGEALRIEGARLKPGAVLTGGLPRCSDERGLSSGHQGYTRGGA